MKLSKQGLDLIVYYETGGKPEKYLNAYWDAYGKVWTIGIGATLRLDGTPVKKGDVITLQEAYDLVDRHINKEILPRFDKLNLILAQYQFDALMSLIYNIGIGAFIGTTKPSTILRLVKAKAPATDIANAFAMWNKSGGKVLDGLVKRRKAEANLYNTGVLKLY